MRKQFKDTITELAEHDERIVLVFGDISVFLFNSFQQSFPKRFYNVGICENTLVSMAAGLSAQGFVPFVHTIAPFATERCIEQIKLDMCYNQFGGNIVTCGATFDYAWDGATHHCWVDLAAILRLPGTNVFQPGSKKEFDSLLRSQYNSGKTNYFRLSDNPHHIDIPGPIEFGKGLVLRDCGSETTVITAGPILDNVAKACADLPVNLLYFHTLKPFDQELISRFSHTRFVVVHDSFGLHELVCSVSGRSVDHLGLPDRFCICYGTIEDVRKYAGLDSSSICQFIQSKMTPALAV